VALVRAGALFRQGRLLERPVDITPEPSPDTPSTNSTVCDLQRTNVDGIDTQSGGNENASAETYFEYPR
jgi:hypothetical protein